MRRPADVRAWVRERGTAAGCRPPVVEELVLLVAEVLVADAGRPGPPPGPRPLHAVPTAGGVTVEVLLPAPLPTPSPGDRLALAAAAASLVTLDTRPARDGGQWVRIAPRT